MRPFTTFADRAEATRAQRRVSSVFIPLPETDICLRQDWGLSLRMPELARYPLPSIVYTAFNSWMGCIPTLHKAFGMWSILFHKNRSECQRPSLLTGAPKSFWLRCLFYLTSVQALILWGRDSVSSILEGGAFSLWIRQGWWHPSEGFQIFRIGGGGRRVAL